MKVGILSLTWNYNFGGTLQTVSLARAIRQLGHEPIVVNYCPVEPHRTPLWRGWGLTQRNAVSGIRHRLAGLVHEGPFRRRYDQFKQAELTWSTRCNDPHAVADAIRTCDAVVVGSDQVWNLAYHPDPVFQLSGFDSYKGRRISYAACCGDPGQPCPPWGPDALEAFDAVSVRNQFSATWVRRCTAERVDPAIVCDPTLLGDDFPRSDLKLPRPYIASYHIGRGNPQERAHGVRQLRKHFGNLPVVALMAPGTSIQMDDWQDKRLWRLTPYEWVEAIRGAAAVFTDSFHAILFAIRNRVPVLATYAERVRAPRLIELRDQFGLGGIIVPAGTEPDLSLQPDWAQVRQTIEHNRSTSWSFLRAALQ